MDNIAIFVNTYCKCNFFKFNGLDRRVLSRIIVCLRLHSKAYTAVCFLCSSRSFGEMPRLALGHDGSSGAEGHQPGIVTNADRC